MVKNEMAHNYIQRIWNRWRESTTAINISKVYFGDVVSRILGIGTAFILIRGMTKSDYALYVAFTSIAILSTSLVGNGINSALVRFSAEQLSRTGEKPYALYLLSLIAELAVFLILLLCVIIFPTQIATLVFGNSKFANLKYPLAHADRHDNEDERDICFVDAWAELVGEFDENLVAIQMLERSHHECRIECNSNVLP